MVRRLLVLLAFVGATATMSAGLIEPLLEEQMAKTDGTQKLGVMVVLTEQLDAEHIINTIKDKEQRWTTTVTELKSMAQRTQAGLLSRLNSHAASGAVSDISPLWIVNAIYCEATPEVIREVAERPEVRFVQWDLIPTENALAIIPEATADVTGGFGISYNVTKVKADSVWQVYGFTGEGVIVGHIDSGSDYNHPDLADHMWTDPNYPNHGWDFWNDDDDPMDANGHGTHTAGTVAGDGTGGDSTGMAPDAKIMSCIGKLSISQPFPDTIAENSMMNAMQFCVAPPLSPTNHAHLLTFSIGWLHAWSPRRAVWRQAVANVAAAGLPFFIAAGNEGTSRTPPDCIRTPGTCPGPWKHPAESPGGLGGAITIGATDQNDVIANFSSRGPVVWDTIDPYNDYPLPEGLIRPDFSAPGVNVPSTKMGGGYVQMSGTSMATPGAAGVCALILSKNPTLLPEEVDEIMQTSVLPLGEPPKNNDYGTGRIDAMRCIENTPEPVPRHDVRLTGTSLSDRERPDQTLTINLTLSSRDFTERDFQAFCLIDSAGTTVYSDSIAIDSIAERGVRTFSFPSAWDIGPENATYHARLWHNFESDEVRSNDTVAMIIVAREQLRILLLYSDVSMPKAAFGDTLEVFGDSVGYMNVQSSTPKLSDLAQFDVAGCYSNYPYEDSVALGDTLAAFVDAGGGVVIGYWSFNGFSQLGGEIMTGEYATIDVGSSRMSSTTMGWYNPASPVVAEVDSVREYYAAVASFAAGAESVACWADGRPYIAVSANRRVIGLNQYPGADEQNPSQRGGDWARVWHNAFRYVSRQTSGTREFDPFAPVPQVVLNVSPNPALTQVFLSYATRFPARVEISVFDRSGRLVRSLLSGSAGAGLNRVSWDMTDNGGRRVASGVYFCRLEAGSAVRTAKLVIR